MYETEWNYLRKEIESCIPADVTVCYCGKITNKMEKPFDGSYDKQTHMILLKNADPDYDFNRVLSISVGPFSGLETKTVHQYLERIKAILLENGYEPQNSILSDKNPYTLIIRFKRGQAALFHFDDEEPKDETT